MSIAKPLTNLSATDLVRRQSQAARTDEHYAQLVRQSAGVINSIFAGLKAAYPAWRQTFTTDNDLEEAKKAWVKALIENRITSKEQVQQGLQQARKDTSPFWPSVGKFIEWCKVSPAPCHKPLPVGLPEPKEFVSKRKLRGRSQMRELLKSMGSTKYQRESA